MSYIYVTSLLNKIIQYGTTYIAFSFSFLPLCFNPFYCISHPWWWVAMETISYFTTSETRVFPNGQGSHAGGTEPSQ